MCAYVCNGARNIYSIASENILERNSKPISSLIWDQNNSITAPPGVLIAALPGRIIHSVISMHPEVKILNW